MNLYYIAILPTPEISEEILALKHIFKTEFGASHALKSPAHITIQMPFRRHCTFQNDLSVFLKEFSSQQHPFPIALDGFGHFNKKVIFVKVQDQPLLYNLKAKLSEGLRIGLNFQKNELNFKFHPHMTIATRDLTYDNFLMAWKIFENRKYTAYFEANALSLLKHNGKFWEIIENFAFWCCSG